MKKPLNFSGVSQRAVRHHCPRVFQPLFILFNHNRAMLLEVGEYEEHSLLEPFEIL